MSLFEALGGLIAASALFGCVNARFIKLPDVIGVTAVGVVMSLVLLLAGQYYPAVIAPVRAVAETFDFSEVMFHGMLSALLFAGSLHVNLANLSRERLPIITLATGGVLISTAVVGCAAFWLGQLVGWNLPILYCLLFGALISPTDPIAVLGILKTAGASKKLEARITGESLFNDGTAVVVFMVLLGLATGAREPTAASIAWMFLLEGGGGLLFGLAVGYAALWLLRHIDSYPVEIMVTLSLVTAGYSLAEHLHVSAPLYIVTAGLVIGNLGPKRSLSKRTQYHLFPFWHLTDEILNLLLFGLIGLQLLVLPFEWAYIVAGGVMVVVVLCARAVSVGLPLLGLQHFMPERDDAHSVTVMTWGGLRGGVSVALALSLPAGAEKELIVWATYVVVLFSILFQATTLGALMRKLNSVKGPAASAGASAETAGAAPATAMAD